MTDVDTCAICGEAGQTEEMRRLTTDDIDTGEYDDARVGEWVCVDCDGGEL